MKKGKAIGTTLMLCGVVGCTASMEVSVGWAAMFATAALAGLLIFTYARMGD